MSNSVTEMMIECFPTTSDRCCLEPQCHRFDQHRTHFSDRQFTCCFRCIVHGEQIVAVNTDSGHAITGSTTSDTITAILIHCSGGDSVSVVATKEKMRIVAEREREIQGTDQKNRTGASSVAAKLRAA